MITFLRKRFLFIVTIFFIGSGITSLTTAEPAKQTSIQEKLAELEASSGGRIGVSATDTANNTRIQYRAKERFPIGCTSKVIGVSAILKMSMTDSQLLQQKITYKKEEITPWSPITEKHVSDGMTVAELCDAAITISDNTAMNLLLKKLGGLSALNTFARVSLGDQSFRMDHDWPEEAKSGGSDNVFDSSTPAAMEKSLRQLALGDVLAPPQREQLIDWLKNNKTGDARIRASVPKGWVVGDKTGTGSYYGTTNDIAIIWPPKSAPIVIALYYTHNKKDAAKRDDILASVTRLLIDEFARRDQRIKL